MAVGGESVRNGVACSECHSMPVKFSSSPITVTHVGHLKEGKFVPGPEGGIRHSKGGKQLSLHEIDEITGERVTPSLLGDGLIEAIDDRDILLNASNERESVLGLKAEISRGPILEAHARCLRVGRFGWKAQHGSLASAIADSLRNELGIRNPLYPDEYTNHEAGDGPTPFDVPDPATGKTHLQSLIEEIRKLPAPARDEEQAVSFDSRVGERLFRQIGCDVCHVETYETLPTGTLVNGGTYRIPAELGNKTIHPYSDFLLHDVGTGDGVPQAATREYLDQSTANKFRTPPLWGLRHRSWLMHDGQAVTYHQAVMRHGGEAKQVRERYEILTPVEKEQLRAFLNSL
jgi:CxxC motif-containing protein (DUF1111 family)